MTQQSDKISNISQNLYFLAQVGYIVDTSIYETAGYNSKLPPKMNFLDVATLRRVLTENGFNILQCSTFNRSDTFPKEIILDGRESVGAIAQKIPL